MKLKFITNDILLLCPFSWWHGAQQNFAVCVVWISGWWLVNLLLTTFSQVAKRFFIWKYISHYLPLALSHYIISSWSAKKPDNSYATHSFVLVDFYLFCFVLLSFLRYSKFSWEFCGKMFLRSKSHYLKFRGKLIFHGELIFYYSSSGKV